MFQSPFQTPWYVSTIHTRGFHLRSETRNRKDGSKHLQERRRRKTRKGNGWKKTRTRKTMWKKKQEGKGPPPPPSNFLPRLRITCPCDRAIHTSIRNVTTKKQNTWECLKDRSTPTRARSERHDQGEGSRKKKKITEKRMKQTHMHDVNVDRRRRAETNDVMPQHNAPAIPKTHVGKNAKEDKKTCG